MIEDDVVGKAEKVIKDTIFFKKDGKIVTNKNGEKVIDRNAITSSQIRKFYTAVNIINEKINMHCMRSFEAENVPPNFDTKALTPDLKAEIKFLKVKLAYQIGRSNQVKKFEEKANLIQEIDKIKNIEDYRKFARYVEALVAFHKYHGGKN